MRFDERMGPKILVYHSLVDAGQGDAIVGRDLFRHQIEWMLRNGNKFISMTDHLAGKAKGRNNIVLTFDDGFSSFLETCLPILEEHGIPATMYCVAGFAGRSGANVRFLSWDEIKELPGKGVDIGCHCMSHLPLNEIDEETARQEIVESTAVFKQQQVELTTLAYPYGRYNDFVKDLVAQQGYAAAMSVMIGGRDIMELRRRMIRGTEPDWMLRMKLSSRLLDARAVIRAGTPKRFLLEEQPIARQRWGFESFDRAVH